MECTDLLIIQYYNSLSIVNAINGNTSMPAADAYISHANSFVRLGNRLAKSNTYSY